MTIRVVLADDEPMICAGLSLILEADPDIVVVAQAQDGDSALAAVRRHCPRVAVLDVRMPGMDGIEATRRIAAEPERVSGERTEVLLLTTFDADEAVDAALRCGARGFLLKHAAAGELVAAVKQVAAGHGWLDPAVVRRALAAIPGPDDQLLDLSPGLGELDLLTGREREILGLLAEGRSNLELAEHLVLSPATVKNHVSRILAKLGLRDRAQATAVAHRAGLVPGRRPGHRRSGARR